MKKRKFYVTMTFHIEVAEDLIVQGMSKEFADYIVPLASPDKVARHVAFCMIQGLDVTGIDGFADRSDAEASIDYRSIDVEAEEI